MHWLRFSKFLQYVTTFVMHVLSVLLTYDLFFAPNKTSSLYQDIDMIAVYHRNSSNRYWFVFSTLISILLLGLTVVYYSITYLMHVWSQWQQSKNLYSMLFFEDLYSLTLMDFVFIAVSLAWNIIWAVHLLLEIIQGASVQGEYLERANLTLLFATQIILIALRYPSLFNPLNSQTVYGLNEKSKDQIISRDTIHRS